MNVFTQNQLDVIENLDISKIDLSFDHCFDDDDIRDSFLQFLKENHNEECYEFILKVSKFKQFRVHTNRYAVAKEIVSNFLIKDAPKEVNVGYQEKAQFLSKFKKNCSPLNCPVNIFDELYEQVIVELYYDSFPRFLESKTLQKIIEKREKEFGKLMFLQKYTDGSLLRMIQDNKDISPYVGKRESQKKTSSYISENQKEFEDVFMEEDTSDKPFTFKYDFTQEEIDSLNENFEYAMKRKNLNSKFRFTSYELHMLIQKGIDTSEGVSTVRVIKDENKTSKVAKLKKFFSKDSKNPPAFANVFEPVIKRLFTDYKFTEFVSKYLLSKCEQVPEGVDEEVFTSFSDKVFELFKLHFVIVEHIVETKNKTKKKVLKNSFLSKNSEYYFNHKKHIVIIGGGFAGTKVIPLLKKYFNVTLIEKKRNFEYNISFYKLIKNIENIDKYKHPMKSIAQGCTLIQEEVVHISDKAVYIKKKMADGSNKVGFDYLIVATGNSYITPFPIQANLNDGHASVVFPYDMNALNYQYEKIENAKSITIIGGGAVAIEFLGEIADRFKNEPEKKINLITQCNVLLERITPKAHVVLSKHFSKFENLKFYYNRRVERIIDDRIYFKVKTENEVTISSIQSDLTFICVGFRPNTSIFSKYMNNSINKRGYVHVNGHFQVQKRYNALIEREREEVEEYPSTVSDIPDESDSELETSADDIGTSEMDKMKEEELTGKFYQSYQALMDKGNDNQNGGRNPTENNVYQVYKNIFAIGDIIATNEEKLAFIARLHGESMVKSILAMELNENPTKYDFYFAKNPIQNISYGENKAIAIKGKRIYSKGYFMYKFKDFVEKSAFDDVKNTPKL